MCCGKTGLRCLGETNVQVQVGNNHITNDQATYVGNTLAMGDAAVTGGTVNKKCTCKTRCPNSNAIIE